MKGLFVHGLRQFSVGCECYIQVSKQIQFQVVFFLRRKAFEATFIIPSQGIYNDVLLLNGTSSCQKEELHLTLLKTLMIGAIPPLANLYFLRKKRTERLSLCETLLSLSFFLALSQSLTHSFFLSPYSPYWKRNPLLRTAQPSLPTQRPRARPRESIPLICWLVLFVSSHWVAARVSQWCLQLSLIS